MDFLQSSSSLALIQLYTELGPGFQNFPMVWILDPKFWIPGFPEFPDLDSRFSTVRIPIFFKVRIPNFLRSEFPDIWIPNGLDSAIQILLDSATANPSFSWCSQGMSVVVVHFQDGVWQIQCFFQPPSWKCTTTTGIPCEHQLKLELASRFLDEQKNG